MNSALTRVCAVTMVKDDYFFLSKWIAYYGKQLGMENLFVISHGSDKTVSEIAQQTNVIPIPSRRDDSIGHKRFEIDRFALVNHVCNGLVRYFDYVAFVDVDEFIVVDPKLGLSLQEYLQVHAGATTITPIGLDVFHKRSVESCNIDPNKPLFSQRHYCKVEPLYCKPAVTRVPLTRSIGNHNANDQNLFFGPDLYLFHLKWIDYGLSMNMHYNRHIAKLNQGYDRDMDLVDKGHAFPLRANLEQQFAQLDALPIATHDFNFEQEKTIYQKSWRRRRFMLQKAFWQSLLSDNNDPYSLHWRFDLRRFPECHVIPERFSDVL